MTGSASSTLSRSRRSRTSERTSRSAAASRNRASRIRTIGWARTAASLSRVDRGAVLAHVHGVDRGEVAGGQHRGGGDVVAGSEEQVERLGHEPEVPVPGCGTTHRLGVRAREGREELPDRPREVPPAVVGRIEGRACGEHAVEEALLDGGVNDVGVEEGEAGHLGEPCSSVVPVPVSGDVLVPLVLVLHKVADITPLLPCDQVALRQGGSRRLMNGGFPGCRTVRSNPSWVRAVTPSSKPISSTSLPPFSLRTVTPVKCIFRPVLACSPPARKSLKAGPL